MNYVLIGVSAVHTGNKFFTYSSRLELSIGEIVYVEYGKKQIFGVVLDVVKKPTFKTKEVSKSSGLIIPLSSLLLLKWMYNFYPEDYGNLTSLFIPPNIDIKSRHQNINVHKGKNLELLKATDEQQKVLDNISNQKNNNVLIHGDTGTGKTRVFTELIKQTLSTKKSVLVLTPEIGLTPQLINDIANYVGANIVITHSRLTKAERKRVWLYAYESTEPTVYLGPRSALFLPINNLGLIILDEAHDASYFQQQNPRYSSVYVASKLASLCKAKLILSTATPNTSEYYFALKKGFNIQRMTTLAIKNQPAQGQVIDLTNKENFTESPIVADVLLAAIRESLNNHEQSMIFLNRRGSARLVQCLSCGWQAICPNCGVPLTYHQDIHNLICHTCNYNQKAPTTCPNCNNIDLNYRSPGTKAVSEHLKALFPGKVVSRFDADSTNENLYYKNIEKLKNGEIDIIVGTQLITKGIDLPNLSVVGIINADSELNLPDYMAEESAFQQLYQVTGRVGRGHRMSKFFIQSRIPDHPVIQSVLSRNWSEFYKTELSKRRLFGYPPFCYIAIAKISKKSIAAASKNAQKIADNLANNKFIKILGPSPSYYELSNKKFTWQIVIKASKRSELVKVLRDLPSEWTICIDPQSLL